MSEVFTTYHDNTKISLSLSRVIQYFCPFSQSKCLRDEETFYPGGQKVSQY
jgi:hypothetical protein